MRAEEGGVLTGPQTSGGGHARRGRLRLAILLELLLDLTVLLILPLHATVFLMLVLVVVKVKFNILLLDLCVVHLSLDGAEGGEALEAEQGAEAQGLPPLLGERAHPVVVLEGLERGEAIGRADRAGGEGDVQHHRGGGLVVEGGRLRGVGDFTRRT